MSAVDTIFSYHDRADEKLKRLHCFEESVPHFVPTLTELELGSDSQSNRNAFNSLLSAARLIHVAKCNKDRDKNICRALTNLKTRITGFVNEHQHKSD